jgi:hypothetical protein
MGASSMDQKLTDDSLTREQAIEVAREAGEHSLDHGPERRLRPPGPRNIGNQARAAATDPNATVQELARRTSEQARAAGDVLYRQGQRTGEYLTQNVNEYPLAALLIAGMIGYGLAYLIHTRRQNQISR